MRVRARQNGVGRHMKSLRRSRPSFDCFTSRSREAHWSARWEAPARNRQTIDGAIERFFLDLEGFGKPPFSQTKDDREFVFGPGGAKYSAC